MHIQDFFPDPLVHGVALQQRSKSISHLLDTLTNNVSELTTCCIPTYAGATSYLTAERGSCRLPIAAAWLQLLESGNVGKHLLKCWDNMAGQKDDSPEVTRFFWPPLIPLSSWSPTMVSAHTSSPNSFMIVCDKLAAFKPAVSWLTLKLTTASCR